MRKRYSIEKLNAIAQGHGGKCLSTLYTNTKSKYMFECRMGHIWKTSVDSLRLGSWCPECAGVGKRDISEAKKWATAAGGQCLSDTMRNMKDKLVWRCELEHEWSATFDSVKNGATWCPKCMLGETITIDDVRGFVDGKGGKCLSNTYTNSRTRMEFQCSEGHTWKTQFRGIYWGGTWCPMCGKTKNKSQMRLCKIIKNIFKRHEVLYNFNGFDWLTTAKGYRQEIDIWVPHVKLAIEYDGEQHFKPMRFGTKSEMLSKLKYTQKLDANKNDKIAQNKDEIRWFVRIPYTKKLCEKNIREMLIERGVDI